MNFDKAKQVLNLRDDLANALAEMEALFLDDKWDEAAERLISQGWIATERLLAEEVPE